MLYSWADKTQARYSVRMRVNLLYFGVLRDMFGVSGEAIEIADGIAVSQLLALLRDILRQRTSNQAMSGNAKTDVNERIWCTLAVALNREYSSADALLRDGDEVALLPPVSGGCRVEEHFDAR